MQSPGPGRATGCRRSAGPRPSCPPKKASSARAGAARWPPASPRPAGSAAAPLGRRPGRRGGRFRPGRPPSSRPRRWAAGPIGSQTTAGAQRPRRSHRCRSRHPAPRPQRRGEGAAAMAGPQHAGSDAPGDGSACASTRPRNLRPRSVRSSVHAWRRGPGRFPRPGGASTASVPATAASSVVAKAAVSGRAPRRGPRRVRHRRPWPRCVPALRHVIDGQCQGLAGRDRSSPATRDGQRVSDAVPASRAARTTRAAAAAQHARTGPRGSARRRRWRSWRWWRIHARQQRDECGAGEHPGGVGLRERGASHRGHVGVRQGQQVLGVAGLERRGAGEGRRRSSAAAVPGRRRGRTR